MADITKCQGIDCTCREKCYRYTAIADKWQSYFIKSPIVDGKCDMFWGDTQQGSINKLEDIIRGKYES